MKAENRQIRIDIQRDNDTIRLGLSEFVPDQSGAIFWPFEETLIVSDLHFEKGSSFARHGILLPPYDTRETLLRLEHVIEIFRPRKVIVLGDSLHDVNGIETMSNEDLTHIHRLQSGCEWIWLTGNHDPTVPVQLGGTVVKEIECQGLSFRHTPKWSQSDYEIAGHLHPVAKISRRGRQIRRRCFISNKRSLVVPAFGSYAGGMNILDDEFLPCFENQKPAIWILGEKDVFQISADRLIRD